MTIGPVPMGANSPTTPELGGGGEKSLLFSPFLFLKVLTSIA